MMVHGFAKALEPPPIGAMRSGSSFNDRDTPCVGIPRLVLPTLRIGIFKNKHSTLVTNQSLVIIRPRVIRQIQSVRILLVSPGIKGMMTVSPPDILGVNERLLCHPILKPLSSGET